ncbi:hypothetical protein TREMEDRAFT_74590 [Tremella mesenterica DSM 1558]|uniref:uncharacterized protein n=1 Tax=Tremella mesenterica (strain ATCC 24925 / CBS 8224 / DSM 1558 / NBRC 9311 / NRRL Y-6157 / RJB 2259-6 / UBC 559-6) TaxID=578456 RepID=UPI0003F48CA8|nr:uncharacterized protein TREMEDRAFT_74590 [Tremella mesenterica DSM 1558]EIW67459.1 hypothetical protein TREMEDRAFT_74590 [Tremella mesenterica DSM 1558]
MTLRTRVVNAYKSTGFLQKPQSAIDAGADDFRPVSGLKPFIHMEPGSRTMWLNEDLAPTPPQMRTWSWLTFVSLWWGTNYTVGAWTQGSSLLSYGLSFGTTLGATIVGYILIAAVAVGCARVGSLYHIGYPVWARSTFGMHLSKFFVFLRMATAVIWFAVMNWYCAEMLDIGLLAVSPNGWGKIANKMPASSHSTTREMVCFFICFCLHLPFAFVHPSMIKIIFEIKAVLLPAVSFGFLGGLIHLAGGSVNFSALNGTIAKGSKPDLGRYANKPGAAMWPQAISLWAGMIIVTMMGLTAGAVSYQVWGVHSWNIWTICSLILENDVSTSWRAGIFIFSIIQIYATIGQNLFANNIPAAVDLASLWPTRINIVRAQVFLMIFSWIVQPWSILTSGTNFIKFLNSYTFFCGAMIAILLADYFIVRRGNIHVPSLFDANGNHANHDGIYYNKPFGFNMIALVAWLCGIAIPLPGLVASYMDSYSSSMATFVKIYNSGFLISFGISGAVYLVGMYFFPPSIVPIGREGDYDHSFEGLGKTDGYLPGDELVLYGRQTKYEVYQPHSETMRITENTATSTGLDEEKKVAADAYAYSLPVHGNSQ